MNNEDFDIKIFSPMKKSAPDEPVTIAYNMKRQVLSGNLQKARELGKAIADSYPEAAEKEELRNIARCCDVELDRKIKDQAIILSVFTAEYCLNNYMPDPILATTALTMLYDTLTDDSPELYSNLLSSTAFSFYYMEIDGKNADPEAIGKTFAMLCGDKNSANLCCYGMNVFKTALENYRKAVETTDFSE